VTTHEQSFPHSERLKRLTVAKMVGPLGGKGES
jgi:hypothetical protein